MKTETRQMATLERQDQQGVVQPLVKAPGPSFLVCFLMVWISLLSPLTVAHAETEVSGTISQDTTWALAGSPYVVTGDVSVRHPESGGPAATLTVEAGTEVRFAYSKPDANENALVDSDICLICLLFTIGFCFCLNTKPAIFSNFRFTGKEAVMMFKRFSINCVFAILLLLPGMAFAGWPIPDSGQTTCYDDIAEIPCPTSGSYYGQDGNYTKNPRSYTKLDASGNDLPYSATSWAMVRDNVTGLIWEVKTDDGSVHDKANKYTWYPATNGGNAGTPRDGTDTEDFINALNAENFGGHSDWRLPTIKELASIARATGYFFLSYCWTATTYPNYADYAWIVGSFTDWVVLKSDSYNVRGVRSGQTESYDDLVINGDGTVTDPNTDLMWEQQGSDSEMNWEDALFHCESLCWSAGYNDWRLPSREELRSIVDYGTPYMPTIYTDYFYNTQPSDYWSATTDPNNSNTAWCVDFSSYSGNNAPSKLDSHYVRCVRSVQSGSYDPLVVSVDPAAGGTVAGSEISCPGRADPRGGDRHD